MCLVCRRNSGATTSRLLPRRATSSCLWSYASWFCVFPARALGEVVFTVFDLDTQSSSTVIRRPCPPIGLEGGAGERVQGARAAYGTCFVCADRPGRPVIPDGAAYQLIAGFVPLMGY